MDVWLSSLGPFEAVWSSLLLNLDFTAAAASGLGTRLYLSTQRGSSGGSSAEVCDRGQPNWPWLRRSPAPSSGRRGRRGSGRRIMPAAALAAPVKPKETVKNPVGSTFSPESNSLVPKRDGEDVQVCYVMLSFWSFVKRCHLSLQLVFSSSSPSLCNRESCQREEDTLSQLFHVFHFLSQAAVRNEKCFSLFPPPHFRVEIRVLCFIIINTSCIHQSWFIH